MTIMPAEKFESALSRRPGLFLGPGATLGPGCLVEIARGLAARFDLVSDAPLLAVADALGERGIDRPQLCTAFRGVLGSLTPSATLSQIATVSWSGVLSAAVDANFEARFQEWTLQSPGRRDVTVLSDFGLPHPPRTIPVFKLMGAASNDDFVLTTNDYRIAQHSWRHALARFADAVKGAPVICVGLNECRPLLLDLLAAFVSDRSLYPATLFFADSDPVVQDKGLQDLGRRGLRYGVVQCDLSSLCAIIRRVLQSGFTGMLATGAAQPSATAVDLEAFGEIAVLVNAHAGTTIGADETHRLRNLLFCPDTASWDPFVHNLDFRRTASQELLNKVTSIASATAFDTSAVVVHGSSATGKTTILKRVALDLASRGYPVLWMRPYFFQDSNNLLRRLFDAVANSGLAASHPPVLFLDDPVSLGALSTEDVHAALERGRLRGVLVIAVRSADLLMSDAQALLGADVKIDELQLVDQFDGAEWAALPQYLVKLGVANDLVEAQSRIFSAPDAWARDVLSMLFWLLPETRASITESVRNEHFRLGDRAAFTEVVLGELKATSRLLRDAYELTAAAARFGTSVPLEVLVSALDISYDDWVRSIAPGGVQWGLLYEDATSESETILYRVRNRLVADIIAEDINGGLIGRTGELLRLRTVLGACRGQSPVYREFCLSLLVPYDREHLNGIDFATGDDLFRTAVNALPYQDRTLLHHWGLWQKNKGHKTDVARDTLKRALSAPRYPYATKAEPDEHIYTSLAANELTAVKQGAVPVSEGKRSVLTYLARARPEQFINANAVHIQAGLTVTLSDLTGGPSDPDNVSLINRALADIDRTLLMLRSEFAPGSRDRASRELLEAARSDVLNRCADIETMESDADRLWKEHGLQDGFALVARRLYGQALTINKGDAFKRAFQVCEKAQSLISAAGQTMQSPLAEAMVHIYYKWRVGRSIFSGSTEPINWSLIEKLCYIVTQSAHSKRDPFYSYLMALSKAHLGDWSGAGMIFNDLRSRGLPPHVLWEDRNVLLGENGKMHRVQGVLSTGAGRRFLKIAELGTDVPVDRNEQWHADGAIQHAYIRFRFAGPVAVGNV
jgi:hypothetical protein